MYRPLALRLAFSFLLLIALPAGAGCTQAGGPEAVAAEPSQETAAGESKPAGDGSRKARGDAPAGAAKTPLDTPPPSIGTRKQGVDWPRFLGPTGDSKSSETGVPWDWPLVGPRLVWKRKLEESYGIGVVSRGRYYQFDRSKREAVVQCLNAETGKPIWEHRYASDYTDLYGYNGGPRCSPLVDGNRVYTFGAEGRLTCLTADRGRPVWHVDTNREFGVIQNFFGVGSNPVIVGDLLIVMIGGSPAADKEIAPGRLDLVSPNGTGIVAFDKRTGKVRYKIIKDLASYASLQKAQIAGRPWCFAFCRGSLYGFDPRNGQVDFTFPWRARSLESVNASTPVVVEDQVLISETYGPGAALLKIAAGKPIQVVWSDAARRRNKSLQTHWNTPIHHEGYVYGCSGRHTSNAELRCVEWKTGKVMWTVPDLTRTSLLYVDKHFICLGEDGALRVFKANPKKYEEIAEVTLIEETGDPLLAKVPLLRYPCWAAPVLSHGLLYVRGRDRLACLELIPARNRR